MGFTMGHYMIISHAYGVIGLDYWGGVWMAIHAVMGRWLTVLGWMGFVLPFTKGGCGVR